MPLQQDNEVYYGQVLSVHQSEMYKPITQRLFKILRLNFRDMFHLMWSIIKYLYWSFCVIQFSDIRKVYRGLYLP